MGFLSTALSKSLFTEDSYKGAAGAIKNGQVEPGYATVIIQPSVARIGSNDPDPILVGLLKGSLGFNINAVWQEMGGLASVMPSLGFIDKAIDAANSTVRFAGGANVGEIYKSKKVYHKSGYLTIRPSMRVVDWNGKSQPIKAAFLACSYCVPFNNEDYIKQLEYLGVTLSGSSNETISLLGQGLVQTIRLGHNGLNYATENFKDVLTKIDGSGNMAKGFGNIIRNISEDLKNDYGTFRAAPSPVQVKIGKYFEHPDMVIEDVAVEFSKEMTRQGPLYVDLTLSLSSRKIIGSGNDMGFVSPSNTNRFLEVNTR
jgi:hypothetical protein